MKYLKFRKTGYSKSGKTKLWIVKNKINHIGLGFIRWNGAWRQYVFYPLSSTFFAISCLRDLEIFLKASTHNQKIKKRKKEFMKTL